MKERSNKRKQMPDEMNIYPFNTDLRDRLDGEAGERERLQRKMILRTP